MKAAAGRTRAPRDACRLGVLGAVVAALVAPRTAWAQQATLRVATTGDYPPFSRAGAGFDVDVARRLAADLGARIEWVSVRWPELLRAAQTNGFDIAMSGVTWRPERACGAQPSWPEPPHSAPRTRGCR